MRISDWSSDVCSSDLHDDVEVPPGVAVGHRTEREPDDRDRNHQPVRPAEEGNEGRDGQNQGDDADQDRSDIEHGANVARRPGPGKSLSVRRRQHRSEEHTSELQSLMRISYAVFCLKKKKKKNHSEDTTR